MLDQFSDLESYDGAFSMGWIVIVEYHVKMSFGLEEAEKNGFFGVAAGSFDNAANNFVGLGRYLCDRAGRVYRAVTSGADNNTAVCMT